VVEVKGRGMMIGVRCADPKRAASVTAKAYQNGLIIERAGPEDEVIKCMMPLTTTFAELDEAMDILEAAMAEEFGVEVEEPFQSLCDWLVSLEAA
jgi:diaminobutyrate-2-oxoglutarate transaminase